MKETFSVNFAERSLKGGGAVMNAEDEQQLVHRGEPLVLPRA
jgi:hypothetical protein